ncbi:hypothetical protein PI125_g21541, partial [Phytophthora idaei]
MASRRGRRLRAVWWMYLMLLFLFLTVVTSQASGDTASVDA